METVFIFIITITIMIIFSAFFAAAETAITGVSHAKIHKLKAEGNRRAIMVSKLREDKERLISSLLLGNTMLNIMSSSLATSSAIALFGQAGVTYATVTMSILIIVFAEVLPKTYAFDNAERVALLSAPLLVVLLKILSPLTHFIQFIVKYFLKMTGLNKQHVDAASHASEEIRGTIELHHHEGSFIKADKDMLGSILDLGDTEVAEIMIHRKHMNTINLELSSDEIINQILESTHTRIPVWKDNPDNIIGILNTKDMLKLVRNSAQNVDHKDLENLVSEPWFVPETTTLKEQLFAFRKKRKHVAMVIDEYGALMGLVTLEDILEEIVGQIEDEHDKVNEKYTFCGDNSYMLDGKVTIRDLNRHFEWSLPDEHASTVAGLIMYEAEMIPEVGEIFTFYGVTFEIMKKKQNEITLVKITKLEE